MHKGHILFSYIKSVIFFSLLKVQRLIATACDSLEYYMNNKFVFQAHNYNAVSGRLNEIDKEKFYDRTTVKICVKKIYEALEHLLQLCLALMHFLLVYFDVYVQMDINHYLHDAAYGTRLYLVKEKVEDLPKARKLFIRLRYLDIITKTLCIYWIVKILLTRFNVSIY